MPLDQGLGNFIVNGQRINILGFAGHMGAHSLLLLLSVFLCQVCVLFLIQFCVHELCIENRL